jgi:hypothetical protein
VHLDEDEEQGFASLDRSIDRSAAADAAAATMMATFFVSHLISPFLCFCVVIIVIVS